MSKAKTRLGRKKNKIPDKLLDTLVSKCVRNENPRCVICGSTDNLNCGHYISRVVKALRWHPLNVHTQCASCNCKHEIDTVPYTLFMIKKYGDGILERLEQIRNGIPKMTDQMREEYLLYWTERLNNWGDK